MKITFDEYLAERNRKQLEQIQDIKDREANLKKIPFIDHLPIYALVQSRHGQLLTFRRIFWHGVALCPVYAAIAGLFTYFINPYCQEHNRAGLQIISPEQRFKNYLDEKYHLFDNSHQEFYRQMQPYSDRQDRKKLKKFMDARTNEHETNLHGILKDNYDIAHNKKKNE
ncbi:UNKNOWN [Stylonychia lemnae]|uniref:Transmembrane protein n=1 Tax=Stylonychia lemnae TaxID=5949 RepID=A0A078B6F4_STYLE|nr:UNKNOWN [Stylonychia lemnae]|eukprot:CDW90110.1 UNKNOWN [Stylonychia lemnae]